MRDGQSIHPNLGWKDVPLRKRLEQALAKPVVIDNNVRLMALGENMFYPQLGRYFPFDLDPCGFRYRLRYYSWMEIYITGMLSARVNSVIPLFYLMGRFAVAGNSGLSGITGIRKGNHRILSRKNRRNTRVIINRNLRKLLTAAQQGEQKAVDILKEAGMYMGIGIINLLNLLAPDLIILHGSLFESDVYTEN